MTVPSAFPERHYPDSRDPYGGLIAPKAMLELGVALPFLETDCMNEKRYPPLPGS
ncbi:hypothetical protein [Streptomyces sp. NPDC052494]|uniref:hypothetical protein n=1 Tax=Streptomyces sp. NPDC052494 TaxID=3365692 RepID=UPI0037D7D48C